MSFNPFHRWLCCPHISYILFIETNKLKSGRNETGMFQELRKEELWPAYCRRKARESGRGRMKPTGKGGIASINITTDKYRQIGRKKYTFS